VRNRMARAGLEPATNGLTPRRSRWLSIYPVITCAASDYVAYYALMVAINSRCLTVINDE
jgi:hypothetical protein